ncbi:zinc finger protein [Loa loa]|uniref:Zinc finger protein n=1 Tax=Loa loa TaxID=7209 RepID=A0A1I7VA41_LOALO|nr:zinc finger protein [Loa loa]EFO13397.2 zinc finger protein [Loa loa]
MSNIQIAETQTEQTELLDLSVQKLSREQAPDLCLLAEVADKMPKAEVANKNTDEFDSQNSTVKMNLTVKEDSVKRKRAEEIAGKKSKKKLLCDKCGNSIIDINRHMMTHTGEKPHSCPICTKNFSQPHDRDIHMRIHTSEKPYHCLTCNKNFSRLSTLNYHMGTHNREKPYVCSICNRSFSHSSSKKRHMKTHTSEKP